MTKRTWKHNHALRFAAVLRRHRMQRGWTMTQLARKANMNHRHISVLERGDNTPGLQTLFDIAAAFGISASSLVAEVEAEWRAEATPVAG